MSIQRYFIKKSVARIQEEAMQSTLKRALGKWNLLSLGIGCIIGAGIFVMTGTAAANHAGPAIVFSFVLAGIACAFAGLCYAELASILPISGSAYTYAYATLGEIFAWTMGWLLVSEYGLAAATVAVGWSGYVVSFLKDFGVIIPPELTQAYGQMITLPDGSQVKALFNLPAFLGVTAVTALLMVGVSESARVNNFIVFVKVSVILAFIAIGAFYIDTSNWDPFIPPQATDPQGEPIPGAYGVSGVLRAASIIFFAYVGFEAVSTAAAEAKNPQQDMPFGILGSLVVCTVLYMLVAGILTGVVHYSQLNVADPIAVAVDAIGLGWFAFVVKVGAILGLTSVMLVLMYGQTRIFYIMSRDGLLPKLFCKVHPKWHTPYINTLTIGIGIAIAAGMTPISTLGDLVSLGTLAAFMIVCISVLYLRKSEPDLERPFRTPFVPVLPILGVISCSILLFGMFNSESGGTIAHYMFWFMTVGMLIYAFYGRRHSHLAHGEKPEHGDPVFVKEAHDPNVD